MWARKSTAKSSDISAKSSDIWWQLPQSLPIGSSGRDSNLTRGDEVSSLNSYHKSPTPFPPGLPVLLWLWVFLLIFSCPSQVL